MFKAHSIEHPAHPFSEAQLLEIGALGRKAMPIDHAIQNAIYVMTGYCNKPCNYCIRSNRSEHQPQEVTSKIIGALGRLSGLWRFSLTGGEVTQVPGFFNHVTDQVIETGHYFSISTNLTAPVADYTGLMAKGRSKFERFSASWHYPIWGNNIGGFLDRVLDLDRAAKEFGLGKFNVACVLAPNVLQIIADTIDPYLRDHDIGVYYQVLKVPDPKTGLPTPYRYPERHHALLERILDGRDRVQTLNPGFNFQGKQCRAGVSHILIQPNGDVYTCFDHMEMNDPRGYLGNIIMDGPQLLRNRLVVCNANGCNVGSTVIDGAISDLQAETEIIPPALANGTALSTERSDVVQHGAIIYERDFSNYVARFGVR